MSRFVIATSSFLDRLMSGIATKASEARFWAILVYFVDYFQWFFAQNNDLIFVNRFDTYKQIDLTVAFIWLGWPDDICRNKCHSMWALLYSIQEFNYSFFSIFVAWNNNCISKKNVKNSINKQKHFR